MASKNLQGESGLSVSSATVRNIMSELEDRGFLASPHTSAGRVPTAQGYRFFVDSLLQVGPVEEGAVTALNAGLDPNRSSGELVQTASNLLAQITYQTGIVTVPKPAASQLRQIEFLPLSGDRVLVILVINEREVQNRIIQMQRPMDEEQLKAAAELINQRYAGNDLSAVKEHIVREMSEARARIDHYLEAALELANAAIETEQQSENVVVAGEASLLNQASPEDMQKLRELFDAFERKRDLLELMERCSRADGIKIFIGEEAGFDVFGDFSVITAPYAQGSQSLGAWRDRTHPDGLRTGDPGCRCHRPDAERGPLTLAIATLAAATRATVTHHTPARHFIIATKIRIDGVTEQIRALHTSTCI